MAAEITRKMKIKSCSAILRLVIALLTVGCTGLPSESPAGASTPSTTPSTLYDLPPQLPDLPTFTSTLEIPMPSTAAMDEEYVVYSAVIESMYFTDDVERFVLIAQTESGAGSGGSDEELALFLQENFEPSISDETLADHMQKHDQSVQLERHFDLPIDYVLIDESEVRDKVDERGDWQLFFEAFPGSSGVITLSPIGFNQSREQALVYTGFRGDLGSGQGYFVLLNKQDGTWTIAQTVVAWIS